MSVRFVIGRAGSGKTTWCMDQIVAACRAQPLGMPIFWLLPRQATFQAERLLTCASGLDAFSRVRIFSFEQLGHDVLASCGGLAIPEISSASRQMILAMLISRLSEHFQYYKSSANQARLAACLDATLKEIERSGHTPENLLQQIDPATLDADVSLQPLDGANATSPQGLPDVDAAALPKKLHDLQLLHEHYAQYLGQERLDPDRRLKQVLGCIEQWSALQGADVHVDGFGELSDHQRQVLVSVARVCRNLHITLLMDPDSPVLDNPHQLPADMDLFHQCQSTYRLLYFAFGRGSIVLDEPLRLRTIHRYSSASLAQVQATLFDPDAHEPISPEGIEFIQAPDFRGEVDAAAITIRRLQRQGYRLREIAVLVRDLDDCHDLIQAGFAEHEIRYFADRRRPVAHHPLLQLCRHILLIARDNWPQESIIALLKSGLAGLSRDDADFIENYAAEHHIHHTAWSDPTPWHLSLATESESAETGHDTAQSYAPPAEGPDAIPTDVDQYSDTGEPIILAEDYGIAPVESQPPQVGQKVVSPPPTAPPETDHQKADRLRRHVTGALAPFLAAVQGQAQLPLAEIVDHLYQVMQALEVRQGLTRWMAQAEAQGHYQQRDEHVQVWRELVDLLTSLRDILGMEQISLHRFIQILEAGLERFDLGLTPPTVDQVLLGQVDRTHTSQVRAVIVLGMDEGSFPKLPQEDSIFSDADRRGLRQRNNEIHADSQRQLLDEYLLAYIAFTRPSEKLILVRSSGSNDQTERAASIFWKMLRVRCPEAPLSAISHDMIDRSPDFLHTPRQLITGLMRWARRQAEAEKIRQMKLGKISIDLPAGSPPRAHIESPAATPAGYSAQSIAASAAGSSVTSHAVSSGPAHPSNSRQNDAATERGNPIAIHPGQEQAASPSQSPEHPAWACLYQWLARRPVLEDAINIMRTRAWDALIYNNKPTLHAETITRLWHDPLVARARQLESFAACPFQHFARHVLHLEDSHTSDRLSGLDLSGVYHDALRQLVRLMIRENLNWKTLNPATAQKLAAEGARTAAARIRQKVMFSNSRNRQTLLFLQQSLDRFIRQQQTLAHRQEAHPSAAGVSFGYHDSSLPHLSITTPRGHHLHLVGSIDRIDRIDLPNESGFALIDYHLSASAGNLAMVQTGVELQMLAHMLYLSHHGQRIDRAFQSPAAGWNVPMERKITPEDHPEDAPDPDSDKFILAAKPAGWINERFLQALDNQLDAGTASDAIGVKLTVKGQIDKRSSKGVINDQQFTNLLQYVGQKMGELTDGILSGSIDVAPYRIGQTSPCAKCNLFKLCRFDPTLQNYNWVKLANNDFILDGDGTIDQAEVADER